MVTLAPIESDNDGDNVGMDAVHPAIAGVITSDMVPPSMMKKSTPVMLFAGSKSTDTVMDVAAKKLAARVGCAVQFAETLISLSVSERSQLRAVATGRLDMSWVFAPSGLCESLVLCGWDSYQRYYEDA